MADTNKRQADQDASEHRQKRQKPDGPRKWRVERKSGAPKSSAIEPGDSGVFATCTRGKEGQARAELHELLSHYVDALHPTKAGPDAADKADSDEDIEAEIQAELDQAKMSDKTELLETIRMDMECVVFCKVQPPVNGTALVQRVCHDAQQNMRPQQSRFLKRLTPVTLVAKATEDGLDELAKTVLAPYFHQQGQASKKVRFPRQFAIRPTIRNSSSLERTTIIQRVARVVGSSHSVDLKGYDFLILVDVWTNLCGMAVVGSDFESLKRFNLAELYTPALPRSAPEARA